MRNPFTAERFSTCPEGPGGDSRQRLHGNVPGNVGMFQKRGPDISERQILQQDQLQGQFLGSPGEVLGSPGEVPGTTGKRLTLVLALVGECSEPPGQTASPLYQSLKERPSWRTFSSNSFQRDPDLGAQSVSEASCLAGPLRHCRQRTRPVGSLANPSPLQI